MTKAALKSSAAPVRGVDGSRRKVASDSARVRVQHVVIPGHEAKSAQAESGEKLSDFLIRNDWTRQRKIDGRLRWIWTLPTICLVNGQPLLQRQWKRKRVRAGDTIVFVSRPLGGRMSGKQWGAIAAAIALAVFAPWAGGLAAGALGLTGMALSIGTAVISAGIAVGGSLLISALIMPKAGGQSDANARGQVDQLYTVQAQGNSVRPLQPIPVQYGRLKIIPDLAAQAWSEFIGNDQYLNILLSRGCGRYQVHQVLTDDTIIYDEVDGQNPSFGDVTIEHYYPLEPITLFPTNIVTSIEVSGQQLPGGENWIGGYIANAAGTVANKIYVDVVFPAGLFRVNDQGEFFKNSTSIVVQGRRVDNNGAPLGPFATLLEQEYESKKRSPLRFTERISVAEGRWEIRVRRSGDIEEGPKEVDNVVWAGLRAAIVGAPATYPCSTTGIRIKATAFTQESARRFGIIQTRILPVWNSATEEWVDQPTRNPWWAFYDAATNEEYGPRRPPSRIDFQTIVSNAAIDEANEKTFDHQFVATVPVPEAFDTILKPVRCRHRWSGDILTAVRDEWREIPRMLLTDREIIRGSVDIVYQLNAEDSADSVLIEYLDEDTWRASEVQYPPNSQEFTSVRPARLRIDGLVNRQNAYEEAAFFYLQATYRRTRLTLETEHDGKLLGFGSTVHVQTELPDSWGQGGTVVSRNALVIEADRSLNFDDPGQYYISFRDRRGRPFGPVKCSWAGVDDTLINLDGPDLALVEGQFGTTLADVLARADGAEEPSFELGVGARRARKCLVVNGRPNGDRVVLSLIVNNEAAYPNDPSGLPEMPAPPVLNEPKSPEIKSLFANFRQGVAEPVLTASWFPAAGAQYYIAEVSYDEGVTWTPVYEGNSSSFEAVVDRAAVRLRVQGVGVRRGAWSSVDVDAPTIELAPNVIDFPSFQEGPRDYLTNQLRQEVERLKASVQSVAGLIGAQDSQNWTDRVEDRRILQIVKGGLSATIEEVRTVAVGIGTSLAALTLTVNAAVADIGNVQSAVSQVQQQFTAFAGVDGTFANYQLSVASQFTSVNDGLADIVQDFTTFAGPGGTFAEYQTSVTSSLNGLQSSITTTQTTVAGIEGALAATWSVTTNVNNHVTGLKLYNSGTFGFFVLEVDYFQIAKTGTTGGAAKTLFEIGTVDSVANIVLKGNMFADGFLQVRHLTAESITAITANITNLNATNINSAYAMFNGGGYNGSLYNDERQQNVSNSENRPQTSNTSTAVISKTFTTVSGALVIRANLVAYGGGQQIRFGNGNWGANGEAYRINATLRVRNSVGTVLGSASLGVSPNATVPTLTGEADMFITVPASETVTIDILGGYQFAASQNNSGQEISYRWYFKVDPQKASVLILEPYGMTAL